jgi:hypothetical protein
LLQISGESLFQPGIAALLEFIPDPASLVFVRNRISPLPAAEQFDSLDAPWL